MRPQKWPERGPQSLKTMKCYRRQKLRHRSQAEPQRQPRASSLLAAQGRALRRAQPRQALTPPSPRTPSPGEKERWAQSQSCGARRATCPHPSQSQTRIFSECHHLLFGVLFSLVSGGKAVIARLLSFHAWRTSAARVLELCVERGQSSQGSSGLLPGGKHTRAILSLSDHSMFALLTLRGCTLFVR